MQNILISQHNAQLLNNITNDKPTNPNTDKNDDDGVYCVRCLDYVSDEDNPILICEGNRCKNKYGVHLQCIGLSAAPVDKFKCGACLYQVCWP